MRALLLALVLFVLGQNSRAQTTTGMAPATGVELSYHTYGEGSPLLVLNGGPGLSSVHFEPLARNLADLGSGYRVILFEQRGTGGSPLVTADSSTVTTALMVDDIEALRRHLGIEAWAVLGHSWGGMYAMLYATAHPERVRGLILSSSAAPTSTGSSTWGPISASGSDRSAARSTSARSTLNTRPSIRLEPSASVSRRSRRLRL